MNNSGGGGLGSLSRRYESNGDPGTIANNPGDIGGASYGSYQIATNTGTMSSFLNFLKSAAPQVASLFQGKKPGTQPFNSTWKKLAQDDKREFEKIQQNFIQSSHFNPVVSKVRDLGLDVTKRSRALQDVVWSTSVQHGVGGATTVIRNALAGNPKMSDAELIKRIYAERGANNGMKYFSSSSPQIRKSVVNRFKSELNDALGML